MRRRIVVGVVALAAVLGAAGGTVAALSGGPVGNGHAGAGVPKAPARPVAAVDPSVSSPTPTTAAAPTTTTTSPPPTVASGSAPVQPATAPTRSVPSTTTPPPAPAIGAPAGSRYGPTGQPTE